MFVTRDILSFVRAILGEQHILILDFLVRVVNSLILILFIPEDHTQPVQMATITDYHNLDIKGATINFNSWKVINIIVK